MPKYNVHLYREMRLYYPDIEAETPQAAARLASEKLTRDAATVEDCYGTDLAALVDHDGDEDLENSAVIDFVKTTPLEDPPCS